MKLKPIEDHIVVKVPTAVEEKTVGGIIIQIRQKRNLRLEKLLP